MWDNSGAEEDLYKKNMDQRMLPTADEHLAQVGKELANEVRQIKQVQPVPLETDFWSASAVLVRMHICSM